MATSIIKTQRLEEQQEELQRLQEVHRLREQVTQLTTGQFHSFVQWVRQLVIQLEACHQGNIAPDAIQNLSRLEQQRQLISTQAHGDYDSYQGSDDYHSLYSAWRRNTLTLVDLFAPSSPAREYHPLPRRPQGRVLIVTPEPALRDLLVDLFMAMQAYEPQAVRDEDEALRWIEERRRANQSFPIAILVHQVASLDGEAFESRLRRSMPPHFRAASRIILFGDGSDPNASAGHRAVDLLQTRLDALHHLVDELC